MQPLKSKTRRIKFWFYLTWAYTIRYRKILSASILLTLMLFWAFFKIWPAVSRSNVITQGHVGTYTIESIPTEVLSQATESLISADVSGRPIPKLSSHWTISADGKTYVVFLRDNLKWHNDTQVDAKDITIAIDNVQITALNNKAIEFRLPNPIASFPTILDKPVFKSKTFYGTGEFRIVDIDKIGEIIKKISLVPKAKNLPRVDIKFYQTEEQLANAVKIGEVKSASVASASQFETWSNLEVEKSVDASEVITVFFNTADRELASKELRQALIFGIERGQFDGIAASSPISPKSWAYSTNVKRYEYNTGRAKELLTKSQASNPQITLTVTGDLRDLAMQIKKNWEEIGIKVELKEEKQIPKDFQALLAVNKIPADPDQYSLWHSTQKDTNLTRLRDVKIDKLLEDGRTVQDEEERKKLYGDFQRFLTEDAPAAFLYHPYKYHVVYKNIKPLLAKLPK